VSPPLVLLHGFTGSADSWAAVRDGLPRRRILAPALIGHDGSAGPASVGSFDDELDRLARLVREQGDDGGHVVGYSMGGRVALGLLIRHAGLFSGATLIGASPGLATAAERRDRARQDEERARLLEARGLPTFVAAWEAVPVLAMGRRVPPEALARQRRIRLSHDPHGLARALRVLGLAAMPDYRPALGDIQVPVRLAVGALDARFVALAREMAERLPRRELHIVEEAGHNILLERPAEIVRLLKELRP
jgi:2-succinyl-6-hydroxy-2,4-cyclohexadiene-1-carboxylate synthase